jgi:hypothetical protein
MRALEIINHSLWGLVQLDIEINPDKFLPFDEGRFHYKNALNDFYKFANQQNDCRLDMIERLVIEKYASIMIKKAEELGNIFKRHRNKKVIIKSTFYDLILWSSIGHANHKAT